MSPVRDRLLEALKVSGGLMGCVEPFIQPANKPPPYPALDSIGSGRPEYATNEGVCRHNVRPRRLYRLLPIRIALMIYFAMPVPLQLLRANAN